jgi:DNA-binding MarR family transcriptional regulator
MTTMGTKDSIDEFLERACSIFPTLDPEVEGAVDRICKLNKRFETMHERALDEFGLNKGEFKVLITLRQHNDDFTMSPGDLGEELLLSSGAMTNRLDRLEAAGFVAREPDPDDRRALIVRLTPDGLRKIDEAVNAAGHNEVAVVSVLSPAEQKRLNALLRKLMLAFEVRPRAMAAVGHA